MSRGVVVYDGPSLIDGSPIVAVTTFRSANRKTGDVPQVWILPRDVAPTDAAKVGADRSVCGDCKLRGTVADGRNHGRACYVTLHRAPLSVWMGYRRGLYRTAARSELSGLFAGAFLRLGAYGDPAAVPLVVWESMLARAAHWTAYTHQWRDGFALQEIAMASVETDADARDAQAMGYRVFRVTEPGAPLQRGYRRCPATSEGWARRTCRDCGACNGGTNGAHIQTPIHGPRARHALPIIAA